MSKANPAYRRDITTEQRKKASKSGTHRIRKRPRNQKILKPGVINSDDDDNDEEAAVAPLCRRHSPRTAPIREDAGGAQSMNNGLRERAHRAYAHGNSRDVPPSHVDESNRIFPGYSTRYDHYAEPPAAKISSFTTKPNTVRGSFPSVASKSLRRQIQEESPPSDDEYGGYNYGGTPKRGVGDGYDKDFSYESELISAKRDAGLLGRRGVDAEERCAEGWYRPGDFDEYKRSVNHQYHIDSRKIGSSNHHIDEALDGKFRDRNRFEPRTTRMSGRMHNEGLPDWERFNSDQAHHRGVSRHSRTAKGRIFGAGESRFDPFSSEALEKTEFSGRNSAQEPGISSLQSFDPVRHNSRMQESECVDPTSSRSRSRGFEYDRIRRKIAIHNDNQNAFTRDHRTHDSVEEDDEADSKTRHRADLNAHDHVSRSEYHDKFTDRSVADAARSQKRKVAAEAELFLNRNHSDENGKPRVPETVSIISTDSRGSEKVSPVENVAQKSQGKRQKRTPLDLHPSYESPPETSNLPILEKCVGNSTRSNVDETKDGAHEPTKPKQSPKSPNKPSFEFGIENVERVHVLLMTTDTHEKNPIVTNLMMDDYAYTAYPFKKHDLLPLVESLALESAAKAISEQFLKLKKRVRVDFIDHEELVDGNRLTLVVGELDNDLVKTHHPKLEVGSVVTVVAGAFKSGKGIVKAIREDLILLLMSADGRSVKRWVNRNLIEVMDEAKVLEQISANQTPQRVPILNSGSSIIAAIQNSFLEGESPRILQPKSQNDYSREEKAPTHARQGSRGSEPGDFLKDIDLSSSFDPELSSMLEQVRMGTPGSYYLYDGQSLLSPLLKDANDIEYVGDEGVHDESSEPAATPAAENTEESRSVSGSRSNCNLPLLSQAAPDPTPERDTTTAASFPTDEPNPELEGEAEPGPLLPPTVEFDEEKSENSANFSLAERGKEYGTDGSTAESSQSDAMLTPSISLVEPTEAGNATRESAGVAATTLTGLPSGPLKKRKSVPAMDLRDRQNSPTAPKTAGLPVRPPEECQEIPPATQKKVYVNQSAEMASCPSNAMTSPQAASNMADETSEIASKKGRPKRVHVRDTSSAKAFVESLSFLELKDKLKRMKLPSSGNRSYLIRMLLSALMVDDESPIEALPDMITGFHV